MPSRVKSPQKRRMEIAALAAKMVATEGVANYHSAKRKAALQLGLHPNRHLPTNQEIESALVGYQQLFQAESQSRELYFLRQQAMKAMSLLQGFKPRLTGPVATGTATASTEITLHLYCDHVEQIGLFLNEQGIPAQPCEKHIKVNAADTVVFPAFRFFADSISFLLIVFSEKDRNLKPISSLNNRPMHMLNLGQVRKLVEAGC